MTIAVKVKCFNGQSYDLSVEPESDSVSDFQQKISAASGITPERQTILCKGKVLDEGKSISDYEFTEGITISVVRRVGKAPAASARSESAAAKSSAPKTDSAPKPSAKSAPAPPPPVDGAAEGMPSLDEMMRNLGMGGAGTGALGGGPNLASLLNGAGGGAMGGPGGMENLMQQLPQMMSGLLNTPMLQDYLQDPEKQEASRAAIMNSPLLKHMVDNDPEFAKVVSDPEKWKASMEAARALFNQTGAAPAAGGSSRDAKVSDGKSDSASSKRASAADVAPPGVNIPKLSESYGHALGQSLINSGLGLDPELVVKGLRSAVAGKSFPMALPEYERSMAQLQGIAAEFLTKANLDDANNLFEEIKEDTQAVILEEGKIAYERSDIAPDETQPQTKEGANVLVIVTARLLDGRHFFTCPAADETGESVHPLTLDLSTAPPALAKGIVGMRECETRMLYVHPSACEGMAEMFGDLLPPNALLIFDLQLLSADAPEEESTTVEELAQNSTTA